MNRRYTVLGLSVVLALALSVPALGGPMNPIASISSSVKSIANKALKKAKAAQSAANTAQSTADTAQSTANTALSTAGSANSTATTAQAEAKKAQTSANSANSTATTAQAEAKKAQTTAEGKMSGEVEAEGKTGTDINIVECPEGKIPTGGGFILGGEADTATAVENTQYANGWIATSDQIKGLSGSWTTTATVQCAAAPGGS